MSRPRVYHTQSGPLRNQDYLMRKADDYRRDYDRDIGHDDRRDYRGNDRYYQGYYPDAPKSRPPSVYDNSRHNSPPPRRRGDDDAIISDKRHTFTEEDVSFIVKTQREVNPPITLVVAPTVKASEYWD